MRNVQKVPSSKAAGPLARWAYTAVRGHDKGLTRLCKIATATRERILPCLLKLERRRAEFCDILLDNHIQGDINPPTEVGLTSEYPTSNFEYGMMKERGHVLVLVT